MGGCPQEQRVILARAGLPRHVHGHLSSSSEPQFLSGLVWPVSSPLPMRVGPQLYKQGDFQKGPGKLSSPHYQRQLTSALVPSPPPPQFIPLLTPPTPHTAGLCVLSGATRQSSHLPSSHSCQLQIPGLVFIEENAWAGNKHTREEPWGVKLGT